MSHRFTATVSAFALAVALCAGFTLGQATTKPANAKPDPKKDEPLVDNPIYATWAKHKPGTEAVIEKKGASEDAGMIITYNWKLLEVTPEAAVIEEAVDVSIPGVAIPLPSSAGSKKKIKAKVTQAEANRINYPEIDFEGEVTEAGKAKVKAAGKTFECTVLEFSGSRKVDDKALIVGKVWRNDDVPGGVVKLEEDHSGGGNKSYVSTTILKKLTIK